MKRTQVDSALVQKVRFARRTLKQHLVLEGVLFGVSAAFGLLWLAFRSGAEGFSTHVLGLASLGLLGATSLWMYEGWLTESEVGELLDRRLGFRGRLLAGLQAEQQTTPSAMGGLLVATVAQELTRERILQHAFPIRLWLALLPFLGGGLVLSSLRSQQAGRDRWTSGAPLVAQFQSRLHEAIERASQRPDGADVVQSLQAIERNVRAMERAMLGGQGHASDWEEAVQTMREELEQAAIASTDDPALDALLERASAQLTKIQERTQVAAFEGDAMPQGRSKAVGSAPPETVGSRSEADRNPAPSASGPGSMGAPGPGEPATEGRFGRASAAPATVASTEGSAVTPVLPRAYRSLISRWKAGDAPGFR